MDGLESIPSTDYLIRNMKADLKRQVDLKYEETLHKMEVAERLIFKFIPPEVLSLPAMELKRVNYDLVRLINETNQRAGKTEKRATFLPVDVTEVAMEIEREIIEEKEQASKQKMQWKSAKKLELTPIFKPGQSDTKGLPFTPKEGTRGKTPQPRKDRAVTPDHSKPLWKF